MSKIRDAQKPTDIGDWEGSNKRLRFEPSPRWVRIRFGGQIIADSKDMRLLYEPGYLPVYYFPKQ
ncbi:MAG: DUF427 domain-containing protein, partial [Nitrospirota bacterium]